MVIHSIGIPDHTRLELSEKLDLLDEMERFVKTPTLRGQLHKVRSTLKKEIYVGLFRESGPMIDGRPPKLGALLRPDNVIQSLDTHFGDITATSEDSAAFLDSMTSLLLSEELSVEEKYNLMMGLFSAAPSHVRDSRDDMISIILRVAGETPGGKKSVEAFQQVMFEFLERRSKIKTTRLALPDNVDELSQLGLRDIQGKGVEGNIRDYAKTQTELKMLQLIDRHASEIKGSSGHRLQVMKHFIAKNNGFVKNPGLLFEPGFQQLSQTLRLEMFKSSFSSNTPVTYADFSKDQTKMEQLFQAYNGIARPNPKDEDFMIAAFESFLDRHPETAKEHFFEFSNELTAVLGKDLTVRKGRLLTEMLKRPRFKKGGEFYEFYFKPTVVDLVRRDRLLGMDLHKRSDQVFKSSFKEFMARTIAEDPPSISTISDLIEGMSMQRGFDVVRGFRFDVSDFREVLMPSTHKGHRVTEDMLSKKLKYSKKKATLLRDALIQKQFMTRDGQLTTTFDKGSNQRSYETFWVPDMFQDQKMEIFSFLSGQIEEGSYEMDLGEDGLEDTPLKGSVDVDGGVMHNPKDAGIELAMALGVDPDEQGTGMTRSDLLLGQIKACVDKTVEPGKKLEESMFKMSDIGGMTPELKMVLREEMILRGVSVSDQGVISLPEGRNAGFIIDQVLESQSVQDMLTIVSEKDEIRDNFVGAYKKQLSMRSDLEIMSEKNQPVLSEALQTFMEIVGREEKGQSLDLSPEDRQKMDKIVSTEVAQFQPLFDKSKLSPGSQRMVIQQLKEQDYLKKGHLNIPSGKTGFLSNLYDKNGKPLGQTEIGELEKKLKEDYQQVSSNYATNFYSLIKATGGRALMKPKWKEQKAPPFSSKEAYQKTMMVYGQRYEDMSEFHEGVSYHDIFEDPKHTVQTAQLLNEINNKDAALDREMSKDEANKIKSRIKHFMKDLSPETAARILLCPSLDSSARGMFVKALLEKKDVDKVLKFLNTQPRFNQTTYKLVLQSFKSEVDGVCYTHPGRGETLRQKMVSSPLGDSMHELGLDFADE